MYGDSSRIGIYHVMDSRYQRIIPIDIMNESKRRQTMLTNVEKCPRTCSLYGQTEFLPNSRTNSFGSNFYYSFASVAVK